MALTSKLNRAAPAGLAGLAVAGAGREAQAGPIIGYGLYDSNQNPVSTNLVIGTPYKVGVYLSSTNQPNTKINSVDWDLAMPSAGSYTNFMTFNGASLPNHNTSEDFFYGQLMESSSVLNGIDSTPDAAGLLDSNVRDIYGTSQGVSNNWGFVGWYNFTPTALATNKKFGFSNVHYTDTTPTTLTITSADYVRPGFNINAIPEPTTLALIVCLGAAAWARKRFRKFVGKH